MPKTRQRSQRKTQQRALQKRARRNVKRAQRAVHEAANESPTRVLRRAREFPFAGCWVQPGWQQYGTASLLVARTQPTNEMVFGWFQVDAFCLGVRHTLYGANMDPTRFNDDVLPRLFQGKPPNSLTVETAHEIVYGAIEYAEGIGFRPHRNFRQAQLILDPPDAHPRSGAIEFGYEGRPVYLASKGDNERAILNRLVHTVGKGNFTYVPVADPPEGYEDLVEHIDQDDELSPLWTPDRKLPGGRLDDDSGLWRPGQPDEATSDGEEQSRSSLWVPGN